MRHWVVAILVIPCGLAAQSAPVALDVLPAVGTTKLAASLAAAAAHERHVWRDTPPFKSDGAVNAYVEISRGDRRKWELDMRANARAIDRMIPEAIGGYPVNYGFVPQTVSYDGDPFDALVLGPPLPGGAFVSGVIVGLFRMTDEKGLDSKVVLSPADEAGRPRYELTANDRDEIAEYFRKYKREETGGFSSVDGWGTIADGRAFVVTTPAFFEKCRTRVGAACRLGD
jgi:inorganic pyrophosphatase